MSFETCLAIVLKTEGGYVNNPSDHGGPTNLGITQPTLSLWQRRGATIEEIKALTPDSVAPIYRDLYWTPAGCGQFPEGVDLIIFDTAVNMGVGTAVRMLQGAAGVVADGLIGPNTISAVATAAPGGLIDKVCAARLARYRGLQGFAVFGTGWLKRLSRTQALAHGLVQ